MQVLAIAQSKVNASIHKFVTCFYGRLPYVSPSAYPIPQATCGCSSFPKLTSRKWCPTFNRQKPSGEPPLLTWPSLSRIPFTKVPDGRIEHENCGDHTGRDAFALLFPQMERIKPSIHATPGLSIEPGTKIARG